MCVKKQTQRINPELQTRNIYKYKKIRENYVSRRKDLKTPKKEGNEREEQRIKMWWEENMPKLIRENAHGQD